MAQFKLRIQHRIGLLVSTAVLLLAVSSLFGGVAYAQDAGTEITPSFGDGKLKVLGAGFKPNENVTINVTIDSGAHTFTATANAEGAFELDTGLEVAPLSSVELDARGDQGSGSASITGVPVLPLPQTGAVIPSVGITLILGLLLLIGGLVLAVRRPTF